MLLLCIKIFLVRILDVSLGTVRTIYTIKNKKFIAAIIGFFEALIWFLIVKEALVVGVSSIYVALAYAGGFATGTWVGVYLAEKFIIGKVTIQAFVDYESNDIICKIREKGYAVTAIEYKGIKEDDKKIMLYINVDKNKAHELRSFIRELDQDAFIIVNESIYVENGYFK